MINQQYKKFMNNNWKKIISGNKILFLLETSVLCIRIYICQISIHIIDNFIISLIDRTNKLYSLNKEIVIRFIRHDLIYITLTMLVIFYFYNLMIKIISNKNIKLEFEFTNCINYIISILPQSIFYLLSVLSLLYENSDKFYMTFRVLLVLTILKKIINRLIYINKQETNSLPILIESEIKHE